MMKTLFTSLMLAALLGAGSSVAAADAAPVAVPTVAVLNFESRISERDGDAAFALGKSVSELLTVALLESGEMELVERADLDKAMTELHLSASGLTDKDSQVKLGKLVGAKILITGSVFQSGEKKFLIAKVIGTETGRVKGCSASGAGEPLELVPALGEKLAALLNSSAADLLPRTPTPVSVAAALSTSVKGNGRTVFLRVTEKLNAGSGGAAAETELKQLLLALGFKVVDTRDDAEFSVIGQAVAASTGSYRNFVGASGRVELSLYKGRDTLLASGAAKDTVAGATYAVAAREATARAALTNAAGLFTVLK